MERFVKRYSDRIVGIVSGFDRVLFRGNIRSICHLEGMQRFILSQGVLFKDLKPFCEKLTAGLKEHAEKKAREQGRPYIYLKSTKKAKEEIAREIMERERIKEGLICVLSAIEACQTFVIRRDKFSKQLKLVPDSGKCLHLYFYYNDPEFGFMHVRLQTWLPFTIQVCINGREYLGKRLTKEGIEHQQQRNCFTSIKNIKMAQRIMDELSNRRWEGVLRVYARRVNPWLKNKGEVVLKHYYWTVRQGEYATDVMFRDEQSLAQIYPALVRQAIEGFSSEDALRFLGRRTNTKFNGEVQTNLQKRVEGVRVKHWVEENSIKIYDKAGSILRVETTINNPYRFKVRRRITRKGETKMRWVSMRKGVVDIRRRVEVSRGANGRYLDALSVVGDPNPSHALLDAVSKRVKNTRQSYRALRPITPEDSEVFRALLRGENQIQGVRNRDLRERLAKPGEDKSKAAARITRLLRLIRAHDLIYRVKGTNYYRTTKKGQKVMTTATKFRDSNIALLAQAV